MKKRSRKSAKIVFSDHAKLQNIVRKIPKSSIFKTVKNPDTSLPSFRNRQLRQKRFGDKILEVVTVTEENITTIVTQYWLKKEE